MIVIGLIYLALTAALLAEDKPAEKPVITEAHKAAYHQAADKLARARVRLELAQAKADALAAADEQDKAIAAMLADCAGGTIGDGLTCVPKEATAKADAPPAEPAKAN
jgi:hypothetical protein